MFYGVAGEIVNAIDPYTEACKPAVLITLLSGCGAMIGRDVYVFAGLVKHPPSIWAILAGGTSLGAKGSADAAARLFLRAVDPQFFVKNFLPSVSTGEGLINRVRDRSEEEDKAGCPVDEGVNDKRLFVVVPEFRTVIAQGKRESNTLPAVLREAWDSPDTLCIPNKNTAVTATGAHIVMMAHVTPGEFRRKIDPSDITGGGLNRYLIFASRESKDLPEEKEFPAEDLATYSKRLKDRIDAARTVKTKISKTEAAQKYWTDEYRSLKNPTGARTEEEEGIVASLVTRARPHVLRLALVYALLDGEQSIDLPHLKAAMAVWRYSLDSARWLLLDYGVHPELAKLRTFIDEAGERGRTRTEITDVCFSKHQPKSGLDRLFAALGDGYEESSRPTGGRPQQVYRKKPAEEAGKAG